MESITTIDNLSSLLLIVINVGCGFRILYCVIFQITGSPDVGHQMKKRIIYILLFLAVSNGIAVLNGVAQSYWG